MEIYINGNIIDFELQNELYADQIYHEVENEMKKSSHIITEISVDKKSYVPSELKDKKIKIEDIQVIEFSAYNKTEILFGLYENSEKLIDEMKEIINQKQREKIEKLLDSFDILIEAFETIAEMNLYIPHQLKPVINAIVTSSKIFEKEGENIFENQSVLCESLDKIKDQIINIENDSKDVIRMSSGQIISQIKSIEEYQETISEDFQTGNDQEAIKKINRVISMIEIIEIYISHNLGAFDKNKQNAVKKYLEDINQMMQELSQALENQDYVLVGDLFEYELPEIFENLKKDI